MNLKIITSLVIFLLCSNLEAFIIYFPIDNLKEISNTFSPSDYGKIIYHMKTNYREKRFEIFFNDHYYSEVIKKVISIYPKHKSKFLSNNKQVYNLVENGKLSSNDYLEGLIKSNIFPDYKDLKYYLTVDNIIDEMSEIEYDPESYRFIKVKCDSRFKKNVDEFLNTASRVTLSLSKNIKKIKSPNHKLRLFIVGGSMESYYHYLKINKNNSLDVSRIYFMPLSRRLFRDYYPETKKYLKETLTKMINHNDQIVFFDTVYKGESILTLKKIFYDIAIEENNMEWEKVIMFGGPELKWEKLQTIHQNMANMVDNIDEYYNDEKSFIGVKVPTPEIGKNGTRYVFAENQHFVRGKYIKFVNGYPQSEYLYPERFGREKKASSFAINLYRKRKLSSILLMLKLIEKFSTI